MRNRRFVRPMEPMLRNDTRPIPARKRTAQQLPIRLELPRKTPLISSPAQAEHVEEAPDDVHGGEPDVRFEEVRETEDVHRKVDVWKDGRAVDVREGAQARGRDDRDQVGLFEDVMEVQEPDDGSTRPKRSPKPNPKYSPEERPGLCGQQVKDREQEEHQESRTLIKMISFTLEGA